MDRVYSMEIPEKYKEYLFLSEGTWDKDGPYPSGHLWFDYIQQERFLSIQPQTLSHCSSPPCWRPAKLWRQQTQTNRSPTGSAMLLRPGNSGPPAHPQDFIATAPFSSSFVPPSPVFPSAPVSSFFRPHPASNTPSPSHLPSPPPPPPLHPSSFSLFLSLSLCPKAKPPPLHREDIHKKKYLMKNWHSIRQGLEESGWRISSCFHDNKDPRSSQRFFQVLDLTSLWKPGLKTPPEDAREAAWGSRFALLVQAFPCKLCEPSVWATVLWWPLAI